MSVSSELLVDTGSLTRLMYAEIVRRAEKNEKKLGVEYEKEKKIVDKEHKKIFDEIGQELKEEGLSFLAKLDDTTLNLLYGTKNGKSDLTVVYSREQHYHREISSCYWEIRSNRGRIAIGVLSKEAVKKYKTEVKQIEANLDKIERKLRKAQEISRDIKNQQVELCAKVEAVITRQILSSDPRWKSALASLESNLLQAQDIERLITVEDPTPEVIDIETNSIEEE